MKSSILFSTRAEVDIEEIFDYIALDNYKLAVEFTDKLEKAIFNLCLFPCMCKKYDGDNTEFIGCRVLVHKPYKVFYQLIDNTVYILQITHGAKNI